LVADRQAVAGGLQPIRGFNRWGIMPTLVEQAPKERVDYRQVLSPAHFVVFSVLREARKKIATNEGVSAYIVFTDAELAEIAQLPEISLSKLKSIKGIGDKKADKYGKLLIDLLNKQHHETDGQPNTENS
jgi:superfamily II DNA helicase RecQ